MSAVFVWIVHFLLRIPCCLPGMYWVSFLYLILSLDQDHVHPNITKCSWKDHSSFEMMLWELCTRERDCLFCFWTSQLWRSLSEKTFLAGIFCSPSPVCHDAPHTHSQYDSVCLCKPEAGHCLYSGHFGHGLNSEHFVLVEQTHHIWSQRSGGELMWPVTDWVSLWRTCHHISPCQHESDLMEI